MGKNAKREQFRDRIGDFGDPDPYALEACLLDDLTTREVGELGERLVAHFLRTCGYEIVERNYRCPEGEADLIAFDPDDDEVVFIEVKTRRSRGLDGCAYPEEAVNAKKQRRYRRIASYYAMTHFPVPHIRFDTVGVTLAPGCVADIDHELGAFDWDCGR